MAFANGIAANPGRDRRTYAAPGNLDARAGRVEKEAVIAASQRVALDAAFVQRRSPMAAAVLERDRAAVPLSVEDDGARPG